MPITGERAAKAIKEVLEETVDKEEAKELGKLQSWLRRHPDTLEHVPEEDDNDAIVGFLLAEMAAPAVAQPPAPPPVWATGVQAALSKRYMEHAPSSYDVRTWARAQALDRAQGVPGTGDPLFLCHRPPWAAGMAAPLMHPAFGRFLDVARDSSLLTRKDTNFTADLCHANLLVYENEAMRQAKVESLLNAYVGEDVSKFALAGGRTMDGFIGDRSGSTQGVSWCAAIIVYENELGATNTDKYFQGQCHYAQMCVGNQGAAARLTSCFPTLLAEWQGPFLRISAMGFLDQVHTMPLTPHLMLAVLPDEHQRLQLACTLTALRLCIRDLRQFYRDYHSAMQHEGLRHPALELPAPWPLYMDHGPVQLSSRLHNIQLIKSWSVYSAEFEQQQHGGHARIPVIIKFTQRYGMAVHAAWADAHLAPCLLEVVSLPGGWLMVVMEQLAGSWVPLADLPPPQQAAARQAAVQALEAAHRVPIPGYTRGGVHGDARGINIMVCPATSRQPAEATPAAGGSSSGQAAQWHVKFIDFDWAGEHGVTTYPAFMSHVIPWAEGAGDLRVMRQEHDVHLLQQPLRAPAMMFYNWRQDVGP